MLFQIILKELQHNILSLRLHISLVLILVVFSFGSMAYVKNHVDTKNEYTRYQNDFIENIRENAGENFSDLAVSRKNIILQPRDNSFISDAKEKYTPNQFEYSAYNVFGFSVKPGSINPYLNTFNELNWSFIISIVISFIVFLFTFDSISGEKESKTLSATFANSISRGTVLLGKYLSTIITSILIVIPGMCISILIILISRASAVTTFTLVEIVVFIVVAGIFIACIAAFGMLSSVITKSARVSLLISLSFWLLFVAIVPNTALLWANMIFPIEKMEIVDERVSMKLEDIENNGLPGRWSSSGNPFLPQHELRANNQTNRMNGEMQIRNAFYLDMFEQLEKVHYLTLLSPISIFENLSEAVTGAGYLRFNKVWNDLHEYQAQFLAFFKEKDAADDESPHWYNPREALSTTRKPVSFEELPLFTEKTISFGERFTYASIFLLVMMIYTAVIFFAAFALFARYDVR
ncbi:ABC transporter permease [Candidatus Latescibacterota bacterium]